MFVDFHTPVIQHPVVRFLRRLPISSHSHSGTDCVVTAEDIYSVYFFNVFPQTGHFPKNFCLAK